MPAPRMSRPQCEQVVGAVNNAIRAGYRIGGYPSAYEAAARALDIPVYTIRDRLEAAKRWYNLRAATPQQNKFNRGRCKSNRSGFKGVSRHKTNGNWVAEITHNYRKYHIGCFDTPEQAHEAYKKAAYILHGEFARAA